LSLYCVFHILRLLTKLNSFLGYFKTVKAIRTFVEIYVFVFGIHLFEFSLVVKETEPAGMFCLLTCVFFFFVYMTLACFMFI